MEMQMDRWVQVPIGEGASRYGTVPFSRTLLIVARTEMTTGWLLDFLPEVVADTRIQVVFTIEDEVPSVYHKGAVDLLADIQVPVIPWAQARATHFDLVICSTHTGNLEHLSSRLLITPHGPGFGKPASVRAGGEVPLPRNDDGVLSSSGLPLTAVVVSHPDQQRLFRGHPNEVELVVAGDPTYDRLMASRARRDVYRSSFGVSGGKKLIVMTSTWGPRSQIATNPDLSERMLEILPVDEYQIAMIIHPNIWHGHSTWQVRTWLRRAEEAGVVLIPPRDGWRAALVGADLVLADHGSVGLYAAAIGIPVATAAFDLSELMTDSPLAELGRTLRPIDLGAPLRQQIDDVIATYDPGPIAPTIDRMFAEKGHSLHILRKTIYRLINLDEGVQRPRVLLIDPPALKRHRPTTHRVIVTVQQLAPETAEVAVVRIPANIPLRDAGSDSGESAMQLRYLVATDRERDVLMLQDAGVIVHGDALLSAQEATAWSTRTLGAYPGCRIAAATDAHGTVTACRRGRSPVSATPAVDSTHESAGRLDPEVVAAAIYGCDVTGALTANGKLTLIISVGHTKYWYRIDG